MTQTAYTLNLTNKTAQKMPMFSPPPGAGVLTPGGPDGPDVSATITTSAGGPAGPGQQSFIQRSGVATADGPTPLPPPPGILATQKILVANDQANVSTEDLGIQTLEGVSVSGTRTTRIIPAGQIGNDKPIDIVTEVWTSPDLKTIVSSKRSDPRMGEQTFSLTNIARTEPDPSLFTVPADFKILEGPQPILYRSNQ